MAWKVAVAEGQVNKTLRIVVRWGARVFLALVVLEVLHISALAFPYPLFSHKSRFGSCTVYSDAPLEPGFAEIMRDVNRRLEASELHGPEKRNRVFYCRKQKTYALLARLALVNPLAQGFNLSLLGNTFISEPRIDRVGASSSGFPPYGVREGNPAHVIAHEIVHDYTEDELGFWTYYRLPLWKREGYAEYGSTIAAVRADGTLSLGERIEILQDDRNWHPGVDFFREYYRGALLVEFLSEIRGYRFAEIMRHDVTLASTDAAMLRWYAAKKSLGNVESANP
jgi:hypothetical protein